MGTISKNFSYSEFEETDAVGLQSRNVINTAQIRDSVKALVDEVLQPLRDMWGKPLYINSGYRNRELNAKVGGEPTSQHMKGEAADICPYGKRNGSGDPEVAYRLAKLARDMKLPYDQLILYPTFVHFSHRLKGQQRGMILYNYRYKGKRDL